MKKTKRGTPSGTRPFILETHFGSGRGRRVVKSRYLYLHRAFLAAMARQLQGARHSEVIALRSGKVKARIAQDGRFFYINQLEKA